jgi:hypothetical protein
VDHASPFHHGPAAMAGLESSPELGLRPLWGSRSPGKWRGDEEGRTGVPIPGSPGLGRRHNGGEGGVGEALGAGSLRAGREGKDGRGRSGGRRGCRGALLWGQRRSGAAGRQRGTGIGGGAP